MRQDVVQDGSDAVVDIPGYRIRWLCKMQFVSINGGEAEWNELGGVAD